VQRFKEEAIGEFQRGRVTEAKRIFHKALDEFKDKDLDSSSRIQKVSILSTLAIVTANEDLREGQKVAEEAVREAKGYPHRYTLNAMHTLASCFSRQALKEHAAHPNSATSLLLFRQAEKVLRDTCALIDSVPPEDVGNEFKARVLEDLGNALSNQEKWAEAFHVYKICLMFRVAWSPDAVSVEKPPPEGEADFWFGYALTACRLDQMKEGMLAYHRALILWYHDPKQVERVCQEVSEFAEKLALDADAYSYAIKLCRKAADILVHIHKDQAAYHIAAAYYFLGYLHQRKKDRRMDAIGYYEKAHQLRYQLTLYNWELADRCLVYLARLYKEHGKLKEAEELLGQRSVQFKGKDGEVLLQLPWDKDGE